MSDTEILREIERRLSENVEQAGWAEEHAGFHGVLRLIERLRKEGQAPKDFEYLN